MSGVVADGTALGRALAEAMTRHGWRLGRDVAIAISADAVHYGDDFAHVPFGAGGIETYRQAVARDPAPPRGPPPGPVHSAAAHALLAPLVDPAAPPQYPPQPAPPATCPIHIGRFHAREHFPRKLQWSTPGKLNPRIILPSLNRR